MKTDSIIVPNIIIEYMFIDINPEVKAMLPIVTPTAPLLPMIPVPVDEFIFLNMCIPNKYVIMLKSPIMANEIIKNSRYNPVGNTALRPAMLKNIGMKKL